MGVCLDPTPEMGEYRAEVRRESFYLFGEDASDRHTIGLYPDSDGPSNSGTVEILIEDIPKIRAALDAVDKYVKGRP